MESEDAYFEDCESGLFCRRCEQDNLELDSSDGFCIPSKNI